MEPATHCHHTGRHDGSLRRVCREFPREGALINDDGKRKEKLPEFSEMARSDLVMTIDHGAS